MALEDLVPNPFVKVVDYFEGKQVVGLSVVVPVRGQGFKVTSFKFADDPALCATLSKIKDTDESLEFEVNESQIQVLAYSGFLVPSAELPRQTTYRCTLADAPEVTEIPPGPLVLNGSLTLKLDADFPDSVDESAHIPGWLATSSPIAWVRDPDTDMLVPYSLEQEEADAILRIQAGEPPSALGNPLVRRLLAPGILVPRSATVGAPRWQDLRARAQLDEKNYVMVRNMLPSAQMKAMRRYYADMVSEGMLKWGDEQVKRRFTMPDEGCARYWHLQLASVVAWLTAEPVKPSYSYVTVYQPGAELHRHTDRVQCEYSISFQVDYTPEQSDVSDWPLFLELPNTPPETVPIHFAIGDGLVYRGRTLAHYRQPLGEDRSSSHIFFFYVHQQFDGPLA
jgi:hypothetical protein